MAEFGTTVLLVCEVSVGTLVGYAAKMMVVEMTISDPIDSPVVGSVPSSSPPCSKFVVSLIQVRLQNHMPIQCGGWRDLKERWAVSPGKSCCEKAYRRPSSSIHRYWPIFLDLKFRRVSLQAHQQYRIGELGAC